MRERDKWHFIKKKILTKMYISFILTLNSNEVNGKNSGFLFLKVATISRKKICCSFDIEVVLTFFTTGVN